MLLPHAENDRKSMARRGESRDAVYSDDTYRICGGRSFASSGRNMLTHTRHGTEISQMRTERRAPLALAMFLIRFLTREGLSSSTNAQAGAQRPSPPSHESSFVDH